MLDLVKGETERIDSRFLEPACGSGNFLVPVLRRKLAAVELKYGKSDFEKRNYALFGLMCIYGIELLGDNVAECRENLLEVFADHLGLATHDELHTAAAKVLATNIVHGDALTMETRTSPIGPITFAEWGYLGKGKFQRRDFRFDTLTDFAAFREEEDMPFADLWAPQDLHREQELPDHDREGSRAMTTTRAGLVLRGRNPDVLTCIANLSNDEVFTPPELANKILDTVAEAWASENDGADLWSNSRATFEITSRLTVGLAGQIPDLQERVDHILTKQVFGIGITELTSLLARRSLYCSKFANGPHSVARSFTSDAGNVWFERVEHTWVGGTEWVYTADERGNRIKKSLDGRCKYCGAGQKSLDRGGGLESHAYTFIHTDDIKARIAELFGADMQFDVVIGNPPYQLDDGGYGNSAAPIYQFFVDRPRRWTPVCCP